ncbi:TnsA-like heteromeric transposase endonuclease subunit [Trebonia kvetii]|uniref:TnsA-like heteromeric transposase endonuclease subunit n=1 Tax=Trebonia kvetii TaxID=2480626 RepID=A0A6P2C276_9ACTN|nr:TnsA-like heteromeric transposase endonuclease subunit [Trebonia kvetii]TVZ05067.1 TnsA-like heteromeric transposase endonuclease subunit [Trebonia kvetii]
MSDVRGRSPAGFTLLYLGEADGRLCEQKVRLANAESVRFEHVRPVREFSSYPGQRSFPGLWWSSTMQDLVGFESWLERDRLMMLDFSPEVTAFSSQPFWLTWPEAGKVRRHAPDYFARMADGTGLVVDVRDDDDIEPGDAQAFAATGEACKSAGWAYQRVGAVDAVLAANLRWLSDYRHPRNLNPAHASALAEASAQPVALMEAARTAGDAIAVLPSAFHMLWSGRLRADLASSPLSGSTTVTSAGAGR